MLTPDDLPYKPRIKRPLISHVAHISSTSADSRSRQRPKADESQSKSLFAQAHQRLKAQRAYAAASPEKDYLVSADIMTADPHCLDPAERLAAIWEQLSGTAYHHWPVVDDDEHLIGVLSVRDLLGLQLCSEHGDTATGQEPQRVADVMAQEVVVANLDTPVYTLGMRMVEHDIDCLPIIDEEEHVLGIITRSDLLEAILCRPDVNAIR